MDENSQKQSKLEKISAFNIELCKGQTGRDVPDLSRIHIVIVVWFVPRNRERGPATAHR